MNEDSLIKAVLSFLNLDEDKEDFIKKRIGGLFGKSLIEKDEHGIIKLSSQANDDLRSRQSLYEIELNNLSSAQTDLLKDKYNISWTADEAKKISLWIANAYVSNQLENLKDVNASVVNNNFYSISENGSAIIRNYFVKERSIRPCRSSTPAPIWCRPSSTPCPRARSRPPMGRTGRRAWLGTSRRSLGQSELPRLPCPGNGALRDQPRVLLHSARGGRELLRIGEEPSLGRRPGPGSVVGRRSCP